MSPVDSAARTDLQAEIGSADYNIPHSEAPKVSARSKRVPDYMDKIAFLRFHSGNLMLNGTDFRLLHIVALDFHNSETGACFPSHRTLAEKLGIKPLAVLRSIKRIEDAGVMKSIPTYNGKGRTSNRYEFVGLDECPTVIESRMRREEERRKKGEVPHNHLRVVASNDDQLVSFRIRGEYPQGYGVGIVRDTNPPIVNDRGTRETDNQGTEQENLTLLSSHACASSSREGKQKGNSISGEAGQPRKAGDHPVQSSKRKSMPAQLRKLEGASKQRWMAIGSEFGLSDEADLMIRHEKFVQHHGYTRSDDWTGLVRTWLKRGAEMAKEHASRPAASCASKSSHIPPELTDDTHPKFEAFRTQLEPLARKHGLLSDSAIDAQRGPFKVWWLGFRRLELTLLEAWQGFLEERAKAGELGLRVLPRKRSAI